MKKTKEAESTKETSASAKKQIENKIQKQSSASKTENQVEYPLWTMPDNLNEKDHKDLKRIFELYKEGKFELALNFASELDTIVRDEIPSDIWKEIGGSLTPKGEDDLKSIEEKVEVTPKTKEIQKSIFHLQHSYVLKDGKLIAFTGEYDNSQLNEAKFYTKSDLEDFIIQHHKCLFGENTVIIDNTKSTNEYFPNVFLFDFNDKENSKMYIIEIYLTEDSLGLLYTRITHFLASLRQKNYQKDFLVELCNVINANDETKAELKLWLSEEQEIPDFISTMLDNKPAILLVKDYLNVVLDLMQTVYLETWGKMLRQILVRKYYCNNDIIYNISPLFLDIWKNGKQKTVETEKVSENDHLCELPDRIRNVYKSIKTALLEMDSSLEFNPKKHYISIRKSKNLAFLHLRRKQTDIVVMNPEESTRELIKQHRIKTLPASVQKFWNGECCTIVVENSDNLEEVIELLKMVVGKI